MKSWGQESQRGYQLGWCGEWQNWIVFKKERKEHRRKRERKEEFTFCLYIYVCERVSHSLVSSCLPSHGL